MGTDWRLSLNSESRIQNWIVGWMGNYRFGKLAPNFIYNFSERELDQISDRRNDLEDYFQDDTMVDILTWLGFGITPSEFEYLCAYFLENELGYITNIRGGFQDGGIDISGIRGTKENPEYIAMQCKQWNSWKIKLGSVSGIFGKMATVKYKHNAQLFLATTNHLNSQARHFVSDKMEVWDHKVLIDLYKKYFSDPNIGWTRFQEFISKKVNKEESKPREKEIIQVKRDTVKSLYNLLKDIRKEEAVKYELSPNYVFSDKVLLEMAKNKPRSKGEFLRISGIGEVKYEKHCHTFAQAIKEFDN